MLAIRGSAGRLNSYSSAQNRSIQPGAALSSRPQNARFRYLLLGWLSFVSLTLLPVPFPGVMAAERVNVRYSVFERSLSVADLQNYARFGAVSPELKAYIGLLRPQQQSQLRQILQQRLDLNAVTLAQFLYSPIGEQLLQRINQVVKTETAAADLPALRSALILSAEDPGRLTVLNVIRYFPGATVRIDLEAALAIFNAVQQVVGQTESAVLAVRQQSQIEATADPPIGAATLQSLQTPGPLGWTKLNLVLQDASPTRLELTGSPRKFHAQIYLPRHLSPRPAPLIVISHGLGSDPHTYAYLAEHLASHGFAVAVPEHPGSSATLLLALLQGRAKEVSAPQEFIDRPLDIKFLLDELQRRAPSDPNLKGRVDLNQVGLIGQSLGGYTVLSLSGAKIDFAQLQKSCVQLDRTLNLSLLLQCRALELPQRDYDFRDDRIKATLAINPIGSALFGSGGYSQIKIPIMVVSSSADTVAPALAEQIQPFTWLRNRDRYLVVIEGATHFSTLGPSRPNATVVSLPTGLVGPATGLARSYLDGLSTAFLQTYVGQQFPAAALLTPTAIATMSRPPLPLNLSRQFNAETLAAALQGPLRSASQQSSQPSKPFVSAL